MSITGSQSLEPGTELQQHKNESEQVTITTTVIWALFAARWAATGQAPDHRGRNRHALTGCGSRVEDIDVPAGSNACRLVRHDPPISLGVFVGGAS